MVRDMLRAGPRPYRCAKLLDLNTLCGAPKQRALLLPSPQLLLFLKERQLLAKGVVNTLQCSLDDVKSVNYPQHLSAGWTKGGESGGPGGGVGREPGLGCMEVQVALAKMKDKLERIVPVQDRTQNYCDYCRVC